MITPELGEVQETLLIPLYGRARDAASRRPLLGDNRARELVEQLDYDFTKFRGGSLPGSVLRTSIFDGWVREFLTANPAGTVIEIGTGLNTRFERVDNGQVRWFDLDLPDSIALRRHYFADTERRTMLAASVFDTEWFDTVAASPGPYFFVSEAVLLYFDEDSVHTAILNLTNRFGGSLIAFDTGGTKMMTNQDRNGVMKSVVARMKWICDDPRRLQDGDCSYSTAAALPTRSPRWPRLGRPGIAWGCAQWPACSRRY